MRVLRAGGVVALPTETVYGLAADAANDDAVRRVFAIKRRPADHPVILHLPERAAAARYAATPDARVDALADRFWPGPLTVIVRKSDAVSAVVTAGQPTVALRMIDHPLARAILQRFGGAVAAPSANRFGRVSPTTAQHVRDDLGGEVDFVVDGGPARVGIESTIVDLSGEVPVLVRIGAVSAGDLRAVLGHDVVLRTDGSVRAPGTLPSHYAPRAAVVVVSAGSGEAEAERRRAGGERVGVLALPAAATEAARELYARLRALDAAGCDIIVAELPPPSDDFAGVRDRLLRAAAPRPRG